MAEKTVSKKREVRLVALRHETAATALFEFAPADGRPLAPYTPGAHVDLYLPRGIVKQYSLVRPYSADSGYLIGVKREARGKGGSRALHRDFEIGSVLTMGGPRNKFPLHEGPAPAILIAGGIGITPIICMAQQLRAEGRSVQLHYAVRTETDAAFRPELALMGAEAHLHCDDEADGLLDLAGIIANAPDDAHFYCCGPRLMLEAFQNATANLPQEHVHVEVFKLPDETVVEGGFTIVLASTGREYFIAAGKTILQVLKEASVDAPYACVQGLCGSCETPVLEGTPDHWDHLLTEENTNSIMICCSRSLTPKLVLDL